MKDIVDSHRLTKLKWISLLGPIGVYAYVVSFAFPVNWDFPLIILAVGGGISSVFGLQKGFSASSNKIILSLVVFLAAMVVSIIFSVDWPRSLRVSATFIPAIFIFFLIIEQFTSIKEIRLLYLSFSLTALVVSIAALYYASLNNFDISASGNVHVLAGSFSNIIVSRNDLTFLALMVPFAFVLAYQKPFSPVGVLAVFAMVLSLGTIVVFQSRGATFTFLTTLLSVVVLLEPRKSLWLIPLFSAIFLATDALLGFALLNRFYDILVGVDPITNGRSRLWQIALNRFVDSPFLGQGPHTFALFSRTPWPHNLYLEVAFGHGIIGFLAFVSSLILGVKTAWNLRLTASQQTRQFAMGALAALIGFCLSSLVELSFLRLWVTVTYLILLGIIVRLSQTKKQNLEE